MYEHVPRIGNANSRHAIPRMKRWLDPKTRPNEKDIGDEIETLRDDEVHHPIVFYKREYELFYSLPSGLWTIGEEPTVRAPVEDDCDDIIEEEAKMDEEDNESDDADNEEENQKCEGEDDESVDGGEAEDKKEEAKEAEEENEEANEEEYVEPEEEDGNKKRDEEESVAESVREYVQVRYRPTGLSVQEEWRLGIVQGTHGQPGDTKQSPIAVVEVSSSKAAGEKDEEEATIVLDRDFDGKSSLTSEERAVVDRFIDKGDYRYEFSFYVHIFLHHKHLYVT